VVKHSAHAALIGKLAETEARVRKLEAQAKVQGQLMHELIAETGASAEQVTRAALRACGIDPDKKANP
jgi:hypothetical protein